MHWLMARQPQNDPHLGGACGEIHAMINNGTKLLNPLVVRPSEYLDVVCLFTLFHHKGRTTL